MRKEKFILFMLLMFSGEVISQILPEAYSEAIQKCFEEYVEGNEKQTALKIEAVLRSYNTKGRLGDQKVLANLWKTAGQVDSAFYYFQSLADGGYYHILSDIKDKKEYSSLHSDQRWQPLISKIKQNKLAIKNTVPDGYIQEYHSGFQLLINKNALINEEEKMISGLNVIKEELKRISSLKIHKSVLDSLRSVKIFVEWDADQSNPNPQVHPSEDYLIQRGDIFHKTLLLDIPNINEYLFLNKLQPLVLLHELAHTYHYKIPESLRVAIKNAYDNAISKGLYQKVKYRHEDGSYDYDVEAYASNNEFEYFAEITTGYFGSSLYFPFTKKDLKKYDREGYDIVKRIWENKP
jgi:hypothetical protein